MLYLMLCVAPLLSPTDDPVRFDRIDVHHFHDPQTGDPVFDQLIFWRWCKPDCRFYSFGFRIIRDGRDADGKWIGSDLVPRPTPDGYELRLGPKDHFRRVLADFVIEHWSTHDPEVADRNRYPDVDRSWR